MAKNCRKRNRQILPREIRIHVTLVEHKDALWVVNRLILLDPLDELCVGVAFAHDELDAQCKECARGR
jgi:hypothetical protein